MPNAEFLIFRDSRRSVAAGDLLVELRRELREASAAVQIDQLISLLLRAGELECGLSDAAAEAAICESASRLTVMFAQAAIACDSSAQPYDRRVLAAAALRILEQLQYFGAIRVGTPEGFAYYALHPLDYADLVQRMYLDTACALVVGVRSIGATLSAVVAAKIQQLGIAAKRITVRPTGHPYDRVCEFDTLERQTIARAVAANAEFLICDEGPGRSGSSLLSVAEALERDGVPLSRIVLLCSHEPEVDSLCAPDAAARWRRYRSVWTGMTRRLPSEAEQFLGGGEWQRKLMPAGEPWPAVWPQMERLQYLSRDRARLLTFEGYGPYGAQVSARHQALSDAGFGLCYFGSVIGFGRHMLPRGRPARGDDLSPQRLTRMAEYCAWRAREFAVADVNSADLQNEKMVSENYEREFGAAPRDLELAVERRTICDARMMPHHWWLTEDGRWLKVDGAVHGDDHFFPGPCDIAWDLAGVVVEWDLQEAEREFFLSAYERFSGDLAALRVGAYELAYATFRMAWSKMASASVDAAEETNRLTDDYRRYAQFARGLAGSSPNLLYAQKIGTRSA